MDKEELKRRLLEYQIEHGLNDTQLAAVVGVTAVSIRNLRVGHYGLGMQTLQGIKRGIPELAQEAEKILKGEE